ncbi:MAG: nucleoside deaminase [Bacteroidales bacterium]
MHAEFIKRAISLADKNIDHGGGPFGAVIVKGGKIIAEASNQVTRNNDPTAHAEIMAIRQAGEKLNNFDLSDCILYASCEPCPMCLGAIYWARIPEVYFASDRNDAESAGFDDSLIYAELSRDIDTRKLKMVRVKEKAADTLFKKWIDKSDKLPY